MKNNEEVKQVSLGSQVEFETGGGEGEGEGEEEGVGEGEEEEVEEEVCIGDKWMNKFYRSFYSCRSITTVRFYWPPNIARHDIIFEMGERRK